MGPPDRDGSGGEGARRHPLGSVGLRPLKMAARGLASIGHWTLDYADRPMLNAHHFPVAATAYRGPAVENTHLAHVAVVDASGRLVYAFGDPHRPTLPRSAVKPVQALAVLETGALERFGFDDADLALMCASHSSEDTHIARVRAMLAKAQVSEEDLRCGGDPPISL